MGLAVARGTAARGFHAWLSLRGVAVAVEEGGGGSRGPLDHMLYVSKRFFGGEAGEAGGADSAPASI